MHEMSLAGGILRVVEQARERVPLQLVKAGARIAYLLNRAFAP